MNEKNQKNIKHQRIIQIWPKKSTKINIFLNIIRHFLLFLNHFQFSFNDSSIHFEFFSLAIFFSSQLVLFSSISFLLAYIIDPALLNRTQFLELFSPGTRHVRRTGNWSTRTEITIPFVEYVDLCCRILSIEVERCD